MGQRLVAPAVFLVLCLAIAPASVFAQDAETDLLQRAARSRAKGHAEAPVLVYAVADFQCPHCAAFARDIFPLLDSAYVRTGKVQWVFVNLPLPSHRRAWGAAKAALCAGAAGDRFWEMHDRLFAGQAEWGRSPEPLERYAGYAREVDVPEDSFRACMHEDRLAPILLEDVIFAVRSGVSGTPTFIINDDRIVIGVKPFEEWRALLDEALEEAARHPPDEGGSGR